MAPTPRHLDVLAETQARVVREHGRLGVVNFVVGVPAPSLDSHMRTKSEAMIKSFGPSIVAIATVVEATGFFASAVRAILVSQRIASRTHFANSVFDRAEQVPPWLAKYVTGVASSAQQAQLLEALSAVRDALAEQRTTNA